MKRALLLPMLLLVISVAARGTTWQVGPTRPHTLPSQISSLVADGDTVAIDAGIYEGDVARWSANNLTLRGVGGHAHLKANGASYGGKGIWVIAGKNTTVESVEFSLAACPDNNGAGIRQEGSGLTVRGCYFHDNQNGILAGDSPASDIVIEYTEFDHNGFGDGYTHNLYINHVNSLTFRFNYSHRAVVGHELKSRAYTNYILYNRLANEATGTASREIDLPNGGTAYIIGNEIEQGPRGENSTMIGYGLEGLSNPTPHRLYLVNNTMVSEKEHGTFVSVQNGTALYKGYNNIMAGPGTQLSGSPMVIDTAGNMFTGTAEAGLADAAAYDYRLLSSSPALDRGVDPGADGTYQLAPDHEYIHPASGAPRGGNKGIDIGAHEYGAASGIGTDREPGAMIAVTPNPFGASTTVRITGARRGAALIVYDVLGVEVARREVGSEETIVITREHLPGGIYYAALVCDGAIVTTEVVVAR